MCKQKQYIYNTVATPLCLSPVRCSRPENTNIITLSGSQHNWPRHSSTVIATYTETNPFKYMIPQYRDVHLLGNPEPLIYNW